MATVLGTRKNPIEIGCADLRGSNEKIDECIIKIVQRKLGLQSQVFKDKRHKYVAFIVKTNKLQQLFVRNEYLQGYENRPA